MIAKVLADTTQQLKQASIDNPPLDARLLVQHVLGYTVEDMVRHRNDEFPDDKIPLLNDCVSQRIKGKPLAKIIGVKEFWGLPFKTTVDTLDPRPDTECLIEWVKTCWPDKNRKLKILDIGTGTGCLLLTLLHEYPKATGIGADISKKALVVARDNAASLRLDDRCVFLHSDLFDNINGQFDLIISNPPYIPRADINTLAAEVRDYDPMGALDGGEDGLDYYCAIARQARRFLMEEGMLVMEIGLNQDDNVVNLLKNSGFKAQKFNDLTHRVRGISATLKTGDGI